MGPKEPRGQKTSSAGAWVSEKLLGEAVERATEDGARQLTIRMNPALAVVLDGFTERFGVSRNTAVNVLLGCALIDAVRAMPKADQERIVKRLEKVIGAPLTAPSTTSTPSTPIEFPTMSGMLRDVGREFVEAFRAMFR